jgi:hypothetical protein
MAVDSLSTKLANFHQANNYNRSKSSSSSSPPLSPTGNSEKVALTTSGSSSSILNYTGREMGGELWRVFSDHLSVVLDVYAFRDVDILITEFMKLERYLSDELDIAAEEKQNELFFQNQPQIVEFLNQSLRTKLLRLSQSTGLFEDLKVKTLNMLAAQLGETNLAECYKQFGKLENKYIDLYEEVKSK